MLRRGIASTLVSSSTRAALRPLPLVSTAVAAAAGAGHCRTVSSSPLVLRRDDERLPRGHVRPIRRPRPPPPSHTSTGTGSSSSELPAFDAFDPDGAHSTTPVVVPYDRFGLLDDSHAAREILAHDTLVIVRQLEMLNVFMGFEQANRYAIHTPQGELVGFLAEEEQGIISAVSRQALRTHRPFRAVVMDKTGKPVLWIRRPFAFINSRIFVRAAEDEGSPVLGEAQQQWHPWRRKYNVFQSRPDEVFQQFARIDSGFLAWDFWLKDKDDRLVASINRNFRGLGRELFTDTGQYVIRFDAAGTELDVPPGSQVSVQGQKLVIPESDQGLTLDQRALTLATAVSIDFDFFSRHSGSGGLGFPFIFWGSGDGSSDVSASGAGAAGAGAAGTASAADGDAVPTSEEIYGRQPGEMYPPTPGQQAEGLDYPGPPRQTEYGEDVMEDPWEQSSEDEGGGLFGGGDGGGGGGWGDWGQ